MKSAFDPKRTLAATLLLSGMLLLLSPADGADLDGKPCATCVTKVQVIALAKERAKGQGYDVATLTLSAKWTGKAWYVIFETNSNVPGSHFAYEYSGAGKFMRVHGGA